MDRPGRFLIELCNPYCPWSKAEATSSDGSHAVEAWARGQAWGSIIL